MALLKLEGRLTVDTAWTMAVTEVGGGGPVTVTILPAGDYYWTSATSALATIAAALTSNPTLSGTYTATLDDTADAATGQITIAASGIASFSFTFPAGSPAPATVLGLAAQGAGAAATYTGAAQARYLFLPDCGRANPLSPDGDAGALETDLTTTVAPSGEMCSLYYATRYVDNLEFAMLRGSKTWASHAATTNEALQTFYEDVMRHGRPFRYHKDRSDDATYVTWRADLRDFRPQWVVPNWTGAGGRCAISIPVRKEV
jgi:hypothetical protein